VELSNYETHSALPLELLEPVEEPVAGKGTVFHSVKVMKLEPGLLTIVIALVIQFVCVSDWDKVVA
jgi:hypothetical protein